MHTAKEMAALLRRLDAILGEYEVVESDASSALEKAIAPLFIAGASKEWSYTVTPSNPIVFKPTSVRRYEYITPLVYVDVRVSNEKETFGFLNSTLELLDETPKVISRWHVDLANPGQSCPRFHLQFGGHAPTGGGHELVFVEVPRWIYPPTELILLCELVLANFYKETWRRICMETNWYEIVQEAQKLCYVSYHNSVSTFLAANGERKTLLESLWLT